MFKTFCITAVIVLASHGSFAAVRGSAGMSVQPGAIESVPKSRAVDDAQSTVLVRQIDTMLAARFAAAGRISSVSARREALEELSAFAKMTVAGLIDAAPSADARASIEETLGVVLVRHQTEISAALAALPRAAR